MNTEFPKSTADQEANVCILDIITAGCKILLSHSRGISQERSTAERLDLGNKRRYMHLNILIQPNKNVSHHRPPSRQRTTFIAVKTA